MVHCGDSIFINRIKLCRKNYLFDDTMISSIAKKINKEPKREERQINGRSKHGK